MLENQYLEVSNACFGHGMTTVAVVADGFSLPGLESLKRLHPTLSLFVDFPHLLKTKLSVLRLLRKLSTEGRWFSLFVIINAKLAGKGFAHLTMEHHINPQDKMRVAPALELIGPETRHDLHALGTTEALDLETYFELLERYYRAFDVKRTSATQPNPHHLPIMTLDERLEEIEEVTEQLLTVRWVCACLSPNFFLSCLVLPTPCHSMDPCGLFCAICLLFPSVVLHSPRQYGKMTPPSLKSLQLNRVSFRRMITVTLPSIPHGLTFGTRHWSSNSCELLYGLFRSKCRTFDMRQFFYIYRLIVIVTLYEQVPERMRGFPIHVSGGGNVDVRYVRLWIRTCECPNVLSCDSNPCVLHLHQHTHLHSRSHDTCGGMQNRAGGA